MRRSIVAQAAPVEFEVAHHHSLFPNLSDWLSIKGERDPPRVSDGDVEPLLRLPNVRCVGGEDHVAHLASVGAYLNPHRIVCLRAQLKAVRPLSGIRGCRGRGRRETGFVLLCDLIERCLLHRLMGAAVAEEEEDHDADDNHKRETD